MSTARTEPLRVSTARAEPLRIPRLASLLLTFVFGVVGFALGVRALVKSFDDKDRLKKLVPKGTTVHIDTNDVLNPGYVLTAGLGLTFVVSLISLVLLLLGRAWRSLPLQTGLLAFCTIWILATAIPETAFIATHSAKVTAFLGKVQLPPSIVAQTQKALGMSSKYSEIGYLKVFAILPWIAFLFAAISTLLSLLAWRRSRAESPASAAPMMEKTDESRREVV